MERNCGGVRESTEAIRQEAGLTVRVRAPLAEAQQRLMDTLGVRVLVDPAAPCSCPDCDPDGRRLRHRGRPKP